MGQRQSSSVSPLPSPKADDAQASIYKTFKTSTEDSVIVRETGAAPDSPLRGGAALRLKTMRHALRVDTQLSASGAASPANGSASFFLSATASAQSDSGRLPSSVRSAVAAHEPFPTEKLLPDSLWDGARRCRESERLARAFAEFVSSLSWVDELQSRFAALLGPQSLSAAELAEHILFNEYLVAPRSKSSSSDARERDEVAAKMMRCAQLKVRDAMDFKTFRRAHGKDHAVVDTCLAEDALRCAVLAALWPLFRASSEGWAAAAPPSTSTSTSSSALSLNAAAMSPSERGRSGHAERLRRLREIFRQTATAWDEKDLRAALARGDWPQRLLDALDDLPLSLSVASSARRGFPLVFVNRAFERTTQFERSEVLGRACGAVLQSPRTESEYVLAMAHALRRGLGVKVALVNARKDRSEFTNLLALRPVAELVLGVQCDASSEDVTLKDLRFADDFLSMFGVILRG